jgi:hypothetical protein
MMAEPNVPSVPGQQIEQEGIPTRGNAGDRCRPELLDKKGMAWSVEFEGEIRA